MHERGRCPLSVGNTISEEMATAQVQIGRMAWASWPAPVRMLTWPCGIPQIVERNVLLEERENLVLTGRMIAEQDSGVPFTVGQRVRLQETITTDILWESRGGFSSAAQNQTAHPRRITDQPYHSVTPLSSQPAHWVQVSSSTDVRLLVDAKTKLTCETGYALNVHGYATHGTIPKTMPAAASQVALSMLAPVAHDGSH